MFVIVYCAGHHWLTAQDCFVCGLFGEKRMDETWESARIHRGNIEHHQWSDLPICYPLNLVKRSVLPAESDSHPPRATRVSQVNSEDPTMLCRLPGTPRTHSVS